jgi:hypothetical protein
MQKNLLRLALGALLTTGAALPGVAFSQAVEPVVAEISGSQLAGEVTQTQQRKPGPSGMNR